MDTSIWIDHFRASDEELVALLERDMVLSHPFVIRELALGNFQARARAIKLLHLLPGAIPAKSGETLRFIESQSLAGFGIGYVDAHLLASTRLTDGATLWTRDKRLARVATALGLAAPVNGHPIN